MIATLTLALAAVPVAMGRTMSHRASAPHGWSVKQQFNAEAEGAGKTAFSIALKMQNIDQLESKLLAVSTPDSASYGKYMDAADIASTFAPSDEAVSAVTSWLKENGVTSYTVNGAFVDFAATVDHANTLFAANYKYYTNGEDTTSRLRTLSYSIPDHVADHVTLVDPSTFFGSMKAMHPVGETAPNPPPSPMRNDKRASNITVDPSCQTGITPKCLKQMYNVGSYTPDPKSGSWIGFGSFLNQSAIYTDVLRFEQINNIPSQNFTKELIAGGVDDQNTRNNHYGEANLDAQNIVGIAYPLPFKEYITGGSP